MGQAIYKKQIGKLSHGVNFITICTKNRQHFFGEIRNGIMGLSEMGCIAHQNWAAIPDHFDHVKLDEWIVMPNHVHGLIGIMDWPVGRNNNPGSDSHSVGTRNFASLQNDKPEKSSDSRINQFGPLNRDPCQPLFRHINRSSPGGHVNKMITNSPGNPGFTIIS